MLISKNWLQKYFDAPLPEADKIAEALTFGVAEIEGMEGKGSDTVIDVKVLPDRGCYMLSHRGVAREVATLCSLPLAHDPLEHALPDLAPHSNYLSITVDDPKRCPLYSAALIRGVHVGESPAWLKSALESVGQRSINNIVDATNYVMLDLGTPLHAFDAKKMSGNISVRTASEGETITLLGGVEKILAGTETLITDASTNAPLALAGVKGGSLAEVVSGTVDLILEAATFDPVATRKTAQRHDLRTDASKRYENGVAEDMPLYGLHALSTLILKIAGGELEGYAIARRPRSAAFKVGVSTREVNARLGTNLSDDDVAAILERIGFSYERVDDPITRVIEIAKSVLGAEYKPDSAMRFDAPRAFSCSSLTNYCYVQAGIALPSISIDQYVWGTPIAKEDARPGDLVFLNSENGHIRYETVQWLPGTKVPEGVDHVGIYLGGDEVVHATRGPGAVVIEKISENKVFEGIVGYRRVITHDEPRFVVTAPLERLDVRQGVDLIEEIGRVYGYDRILPVALPEAAHTLILNTTYAAGEIVRTALSRSGFSEVMTYTLRDAGASELANALASDKSFLREKLAPGIREALTTNEYYAPIIGESDIRIFEVGTVFSQEDEAVHVCIGARAAAGKKRDERTEQLLRDALGSITLSFGVDEGALDVERGEGTIEFDLTTISSNIPAAIETISFGASVAPSSIRYGAPSIHPFVLRDIALWSDAQEAGPVLEVITQSAGPLLVRADMFDTFTKDSRTSYAFHLVFQSYEKTLTDEEVGAIMQKITAACVAKGWEVR